MQTPQRLTGGRFNEKTQGVDRQLTFEQRPEGLNQGGMDPFLFPPLGHSSGQGKMKAKLFKYIGIAPDLQIFLFLAAEQGCLAPGHFTGGQGSPETIEGPDAERGKDLEGLGMTDRAQAEKTVESGDFQGRQRERFLAGGEIGQGGQQVRLGSGLQQAKWRNEDGLKTPIARG